MKLAEALNRLSEYSTRLDYLKLGLSVGSLEKLSSSLEDFNSIVVEKQRLKSEIERVEAETLVSGTSLRDLKIILGSLDEKITTLQSLLHRKDLPEQLSSVIVSQLDLFVKTKSQLQTSIQKISWEIEIKL